jgi:hypothetical protein
MSVVSKYPRWLVPRYADSGVEMKGVRVKGTAEEIDKVDSYGEWA